MKKQLITSLKTFLFFSLLLGLLYPVFILLIAKTFTPHKSQGSLIEKNGQIVGSKYLAQKFERDIYFWPRPSFSNYSTMHASASHLGPTSALLKNEIEERRLKVAKAHDSEKLENVPIELITSSGSGVDPHISLKAARYQLERVAAKRQLDQKIIEQLMLDASEKPIGRLFGVKYINVLMLNLLLDTYSASNPPKQSKGELLDDK